MSQTLRNDDREHTRIRSRLPPIFVLQIQYFYNSFKLSREGFHLSVKRCSCSTKNHWVVHWRLHDTLLLEVLNDDIWMLSTLDRRQKSLAKILSCVLSCSSECPSIWMWWWLIATLAPRRSWSSDFSHRDRVFLAPLPRSFYHDRRGPNISKCQRLWFGMSWQRTIVSVSCWVFLSSVVSFFCSTMFVVLSLLFSASCWFILSSFSSRCCATWSKLVAPLPAFLSFVLCLSVSYKMYTVSDHRQ